MKLRVAGPATLLFAFGLAAPVSAQARSAAECAALASTKRPGVTISVAEAVAQGSFTPAGSTNPIANLPPFCRVAGAIAPTSGFAHPLRGLAAAREVERQVRRRRQRRLGRHDQLRAAGGPAPARLRGRVHEYRPQAAGGENMAEVRVRAAGAADRLRLSLPSRNGDEGESARRRRSTASLPSAPISSGARPAATKG